MRLSTFHRYGIIILAIIIVMIFIWPSDEKTNIKPITISEPQPIVITPQSETQSPEGTTQTDQLPTWMNNGTNQNNNNENGNEIAQPEINIETAPTPPTERTPSATTSTPAQTPPADQWQAYTIQKGKTLAQLFRDNNLQARDAFAMARVEGSESPLSNIQQGQKIRLKANKQGDVQVLEITTAEGKTFSFARLSDGNYYRTP
nr:LysM-like peptidoglycan-binding domain-containing protein [uncultured Moellerella sp.]